MTTQVTITIRGADVYVNMPSPRVGRALSPEESAALHAVTALASAGLRIHYEANPLTTLALDLLHAEQYGWSVGPEVRAAARLALGNAAPTTGGAAA